MTTTNTVAVANTKQRKPRRFYMTQNRKSLICEALYDAAEKIEDIDDPRHYTESDLRAIAKKASVWRVMAAKLQQRTA
jgi:hypothetical protein